MLRQWCDIGGPNLTLTFASEWYNQALRDGREVTMNNRERLVFHPALVRVLNR